MNRNISGKQFFEFVADLRDADGRVGAVGDEDEMFIIDTASHKEIGRELQGRRKCRSAAKVCSFDGIVDRCAVSCPFGNDFGLFGVLHKGDRVFGPE